MKIVFKPITLSFAAFGLFAVFASPYAQAADAAPAIVAPKSSATTTAGAAMPDTTVAAAAPMAAASSADAAAKDDSKGLGVIEDKAPDAAKDAIKHLDTATDNVTLDDLNSARQAIAKLDALIDIEKHLTELNKIRAEREGGSMGMGGMNGRMAGAIPASALAPMPIQQSQQAMMSPPGIGVSADGLEVSRIVGSAGHYSAVVKGGGDIDGKTIQVGDSLTDGSKVLAITSTGIEVGQGSSKHVIRVKNVGTVFGNAP